MSNPLVSDARLVILDLANNHMGSVAHGLRIIREAHAVTRTFAFTAAIKFQFRHLDTFIHPAYAGRRDLKYVRRFTETRLGRDDFAALAAEAKRLGFVTMCTPFDEPSVDLIEELGFDAIKIASCSLTDWPLLERIVQTDLPIVASTAGGTLDDIDRVVSFLDHRARSFALMHCVAEYPTPADALQLNQIDLLRCRYPTVRVGFSTHEDPEATAPVMMAIAKGAQLLERHIGVATDEWPLNAYSSSPAQLRRWLEAAAEAERMCGAHERGAATAGERANLHGLRRGVFTRRDIAPGERLTGADVFYAIPLGDDQITANEWSKYAEFTARVPIAAGEAVRRSGTCVRDVRAQVASIVCRVRRLLEESHVAVPGKADFEISHHYGLDRFDRFGITMLTVVNREYCKKLIVLLGGQEHPEQFHARKEETFHVLHGEVEVELDGVLRRCTRGDVVVVERGVKHRFRSAGGAVFEELSSTHYVDDSYYTDPAITSNRERKTYVTYWLA